MARIPSPRTLLHVVLSVSCIAATAGCGGGGSQAVVLLLTSNASCFGIGIEVTGVDDASADGASCELVDALAGSGCTADVDAVGDPFGISVRGCFVAPGEQVLRCQGPASFLQRVREGATTRCGCGCADECPENPAIVVCDDGDADCVMQAAVRVEASQARPAAGPGRHVSVEHGIAQVTTTTSSTTFCGTCCDVVSDSDVLLGSSGALSELRFDVVVRSGEPHCPDISCFADPEIPGPTSYRHLSDERLRICISAPAGIVGPRPVAYCSVLSGGSQMQLENIQALDERWKHVDPAPALSSIGF